MRNLWFKQTKLVSACRYFDTKRNIVVVARHPSIPCQIELNQWVRTYCKPLYLESRCFSRVAQFLLCCGNLLASIAKIHLSISEMVQKGTLLCWIGHEIKRSELNTVGLLWIGLLHKLFFKSILIIVQNKTFLEWFCMWMLCQKVLLLMYKICKFITEINLRIVVCNIMIVIIVMYCIAFKNLQIMR